MQVREAHPGGNIHQPRTMEEKVEHARHLRDAMGVSGPVLIDDLNGSLHRQLDTMPNSLHILDAGGAIVYRALSAGDDRRARSRWWGSPRGTKLLPFVAKGKRGAALLVSSLVLAVGGVVYALVG